MHNTPTTALSPTEIVIADLVARGQSNKQVARELGLRPKTIEWHLTRVYSHLRIRSRRELADYLSRGEAPWGRGGSE